MTDETEDTTVEAVDTTTSYYYAARGVFAHGWPAFRRWLKEQGTETFPINSAMDCPVAQWMRAVGFNVHMVYYDSVHLVGDRSFSTGKVLINDKWVVYETLAQAIGRGPKGSVTGDELVAMIERYVEDGTLEEKRVYGVKVRGPVGSVQYLVAVDENEREVPSGYIARFEPGAMPRLHASLNQKVRKFYGEQVANERGCLRFDE